MKGIRPFDCSGKWVHKRSVDLIEPMIFEWGTWSTFESNAGEKAKVSYLFEDDETGQEKRETC